MALDAVAGSPTANSYVSVSDATDLLQEHLDIEAWYTQSPEEGQTLAARREAALISATRLIDTQVGWYGYPATATQALAWPQVGQVDRYGRPLDATTVPRNVQQATAYYALALLEATAAGAPAASGGELLVKSKKVGDVTIEYQTVSSTAQAVTATRADTMPREVRDLLRGYGMVPGLGMIPVLRT